MAYLGQKLIYQQDNFHDRNLYIFDKLILAVFYLCFDNLYKSKKKKCILNSSFNNIYSWANGFCIQVKYLNIVILSSIRKCPSTCKQLIEYMFQSKVL